ncbi:hypothetical protein [Gudongella sp. DL1XJH-153]|uniref:hypothetical protein n=1 Tax=Gudongella sp. DL1XJH-153 TaxID=3409804 RepID=UPI003BB73C78
MSKPKIFNSWLSSLLVVAVLAIAAIGIYQLGILPGLPEVEPTPVGEGEDKPYEYPSIDSASCVACHTSEAVIAASTWVENQPVAEDTGG